MQRIIPHLWYDKEAKEAALFYTKLFENSNLLYTHNIESPEPFPDAEVVVFELAGIRFIAISAGPYFKLNPASSLVVYCSTQEEVKRIWTTLADSGKILESLGESQGLLQDRFGLTWQVKLVEDKDIDQKIVPCLLFADANQAAQYYKQVFNNSSIVQDNSLISLQLDGFNLILKDNKLNQDYELNEDFSLIINCKGQQEIDYFWDRLSHVQEAESCGWCKDKFGLSWQVLPEDWEKLCYDGTKEELKRVNQTMLAMKKIDIEELERAKRGA
ncbi:MAG: VOC family protein [Bacilli bacterium]|nr:VOC family protein [Bacilli bacterium]